MSGRTSTLLVTGASRGIGAAVAGRFAARGDTVVGFSRSGTGPDGVLHVAGDVADEASVKALFKRARGEGLAVDRVLHSAGLPQTSLAAATSGEEARRVVDTNFLGTFLVTKHATQAMMRARFGRVVALTSISTRLQSPGRSVYSASKVACESLMATMTAETRGMDITYNSVGISVVAGTGMVDELSGDALRKTRERLGRPGDLSVDSIVHALDFLFSPLASGLSGQTLMYGAP